MQWGCLMNKKPWLLPYTPWKTQAAFFGYIRGGLRNGLWKRNPVKLEFLKAKRQRLPLGKSTRTNPKGLVWGFVCEECKESFPQSQIEVHHNEAAGSLKTQEDLEGFITKMCFVDFDDLSILCKPCHATYTYAERYNITFEEAALEKERINFFKKNVPTQKKLLIEMGAKTEELSNQKSREKAFRKYYKGEMNV